jgi:hypothetical protein
MSAGETDIPIYCVQNISDEVVARAEGRAVEVYSMHRTAEGAQGALEYLRSLNQTEDEIGIRVVFANEAFLDGLDLLILD